MSKESKVNLAKIVLVAAVTAAFNAPASAQEQQTDRKFYECGSEKLKLKELADGRLALEGKKFTGYVSIHRPTGMYRGSVMGGGRNTKHQMAALR